jgi:guanyl-specific ribonuclease Sa
VFSKSMSSYLQAEAGANCEFSGRGRSGSSSSSSNNSNSSSSSINISNKSNNCRPEFQRNRCLACNLLDNIWVCMICSYTGCGRYSSQHAKKHFDDSHHPFSLELASGRIWNYDHDTFVHIESDSAARLALIGGLDDEASLATSLQATATLDARPAASYRELIDKAPRASSQYYLPWARQRQLEELEVAPPPEVKDKLGVLFSQYEGILEAQLAEQQLYYEKRLAQETIRALEASLKSSQRKCTPGSAGGNADGSALGLSHTHPSEESYDQDMEDIAQKKIELSKLEYSYHEVLTKLRETEHATRCQTKINDDLIDKQKLYKVQIAENAEKEKLIREQCAEKVEELEQQIRDLTFFIR